VIVGSVNARLEAMLQLQIEDSSGHLQVIDTVIDTGFTGDLTLPIARLVAPGLPWAGEVVLQLGDGSAQTIDVYKAILMWDSNPIQVGVYAVETAPLLGTRLLAGHEVKVQFVPGGAVTIVPIP
jgi:predicted aspartyl protease